MIVSFADRATEDIWEGLNTAKARKRLPKRLWQQATDKLTLLDAAGTLNDLRVPPGNRLERLKGDRTGQHSIRINDQYRICFEWTKPGPSRVEIVDYHG